MAVIAVGDFQAKDVINTITGLFDIAPEDISPLSRSPDPPESPTHPVPDTEGIAVATSTDRELSFAQGMVDCKRPRAKIKNLKGFQRRMTEDLFHKALSSRLLKLMIEPKGPRNFFMAGTETGEPVPALNDMCITIAPLPGRMRPALQSIAREIERVKRHGFHENEVLRAKRSILAEFEEGYIEREQRPSESFAEEFVTLFLDDEPAPSIKDRARLAAMVLPAIPTSEISAVAHQYNFEKNVVVKISTPPLSFFNPLYTIWSFVAAIWHRVLPRPKLDLPDTSEVAKLMQSVANEELEQWPADEDDVDSRLRRQFDSCNEQRAWQNGEMTISPKRVVEAAGVPHPVRGANTSPFAETPSVPLGEEFILQNGLRIFLKRTDLFDDEIILRGRRWGGLSEHQSSGMLGQGPVSSEAQVCSMAAMMLGICGLSVESLQECLDGKRLEPNPPTLESYTTGLDASTSPADLEALLTLLHLLFVCPVEPSAKSRGRLSLVKLGLLAWRLGEDRDPQALFRRRVQKCITGDHPFTRLPSIWSILRLNFKKASAIFNERASSPRDWTFVIVGKLPADDVLLPLLKKYLGSVPNKEALQTNGSPAASSSLKASNERPDELAAREAVAPINVSFPQKSHKEEVHLQMIDPKGSTLVCFPIALKNVTDLAAPKSTEAELHDLFMVKFLIRMLETRLVEVLRFKRGQVYSVSVGDDFSLAPPQLGSRRTGTLSISFECDPAEADELVDTTNNELLDLRCGRSEFTNENITAAQQQERREFEETVLKNDFWASTILDLYFARCRLITGDVGSAMALWWRVHKEVLEGLTVESAGEALRVLLPEDAASVVLTMRPKRRWWEKKGTVKSQKSAKKED